ncbi:MAG: flagellar biosynthetic protein FliR [Candidatus Abyssobacteria bacterium SURF_17]|jgi:flagellar biosynthetic protein FliR|uniref:Flagellar biosynthetic protein FliR n=1 Tax=Candidatus Abyssobacteria bacterium SURF_17 TaxID=2093361 RepID=A0A419EY04_9BACT|nr:MAG: flagellar biosynthetic protein FliR [Candidatus Abyssubacteria bacterium SURF_17]
MENPLTFTLLRFEAFMLILMRVGAMLFVAPVFGGSAVPTQAKVLLSMVLSLVLLPLVSIPAGMVPLDILPLAWLGTNELLIGLVMGASLTFLFAAIQYAGQIVDFQMGFSIVNLIDPTQDVQIPVMGLFHFLIATLLFLAMDAHHWIIRALVDSFEAVPLMTAGFSSLVIGSVAKAFGDLFVIAMRIAAPAIAVLMLYNVSLGIIAKTVPQINLLIVGFPIRIALGMIVVGLSMAFFHPYLSHAFDVMVANVYLVIEQL